MNQIQEQAIQAITEAQKGVKQRSAAWMVGEQLKDICRCEPESAQLILQDLSGGGMGLEDAEKQIKAFADKHRVGSFACVLPDEADGILRKFYGLPGRQEKAEVHTDQAPAQPDGVLSIFDFM